MNITRDYRWQVKNQVLIVNILINLKNIFLRSLYSKAPPGLGVNHNPSRGFVMKNLFVINLELFQERTIILIR